MGLAWTARDHRQGVRCCGECHYTNTERIPVIRPAGRGVTSGATARTCRVQPHSLLGGCCVLLAFYLQRDVDELVFLAADELALPGPVEQLMRGHAVAL